MRSTSLHVLLLMGAIFLHGSARTQRTPSSVSNKGYLLYEKHCASCHQQDGAGVTRLIPPLVGTDYVSGNKNRLIQILLKGLNERIIVQEEEYFSPMASFQYLSDQEIADVLTFVRARFGGGVSPVSAREVQGERKKLKK